MFPAKVLDLTGFSTEGLESIWSWLSPSERRAVMRFEPLWGFINHIPRQGSFWPTMRKRMAQVYWRLETFRRIKALIVERYRSRRYGLVIARRRGVDDIVCAVCYHPGSFLSLAFNSPLRGGMKSEDLICPTIKMDTTQRAVEIYCAYTLDRREGKRHLYTYLMSEEDASFETRFDAASRIAHIWESRYMKMDCEGLIQQYCTDTIQNKGRTTAARLKLFLSENREIAEYIWKVNFGSETARRSLAAALGISHKRTKAFVTSASIEELDTAIHSNMPRRSKPQRWG
jgi:hypothetical protein